MFLTLALMVQSAGPAAVRTRPVCTPSQNDQEILVCAQGDDAEQFRILEPLRDSREDDGPRRVRVDLRDGVGVELYGEQGGVGGFPSQRVMGSINIPF